VPDQQILGLARRRPVSPAVVRPRLTPPRRRLEQVTVVPGRKPFGVLVDRCLAAAALAAAAPVLAAAAVAIKATSRGPVLFRQERIGLGGRPFSILKLRTMRADADDRLHRELCRRELLEPEADAGTTDGAYKLERDPRVTAVGRFLRRASIDELPQLANVVRGEMSLVGPRPLLAYEVELHDPFHRQRHLVRPGLTGLWQVSGRNKLTARQMLDLDVRYVAARSWRLDLSILARTPSAVFRGDGAR
jgi:lipopolysaccharide/colanic/teichoic acid biosynthesis glycosyltransferase